MDWNLCFTALISPWFMAGDGIGVTIVTDLKDLSPLHEAIVGAVDQISELSVTIDIMPLDANNTPIPSLNAVLLLNCGTKLHQEESSRPCLCYEDADLTSVVLCPAEIELRRAEMAAAVVEQGEWNDLIIVSDDTSYAPLLEVTITSRRDVVYSRHGCVELTPDALVDIVQRYTHIDDHVNVVWDCAGHSTTVFLREFYSEILTFGHVLEKVRFNWIMQDRDLNLDGTFQSFLREGDNLAIVQAMIESRTLTSLLKDWILQDEFSLVKFSIGSCLNYCEQPGSLKRIGTFTDARSIFAMMTPILPAEFRQFYRKHLIVAGGGEYFPFHQTKNISGELIHIGIDVEVLDVLSEIFNFTYTIVPSVDGKYGSLEPDGTWNGMVGMVQRGEADMAIGGITVSESRLQAIDFTTPHFMETGSMMLRLPWYRWSFFYSIFSTDIGACLLCMPALVATCFIFIEKVSKLWINDKCRRFSKVDTLISCYGILFMHAGPAPQGTMSARILLFCYWMTVVILASTYAGNLTASLAVKQVKMPFNSLDEIPASEGYRLMTQVGTVYETLFQDAKSGIYKELWDKTLESGESGRIVTFAEAIGKLQGEPGWVFPSDKTLLRSQRYLAGDCNMVLIKEEYFPSGLGIGLRKGSPYKKHFDKIIHRALEVGLGHHWAQKHKFEDTCSDITEASANTEDITMEDSFYIFVALAVGLGSGFIVFCLETTWKSLKERLKSWKQQHTDGDSTDDVTWKETVGTKSPYFAGNNSYSFLHNMRNSGSIHRLSFGVHSSKNT